LCHGLSRLKSLLQKNRGIHKICWAISAPAHGCKGRGSVFIVIPAKAGIYSSAIVCQAAFRKPITGVWIPAFAGMTTKGDF
jgi:hypothetical protein